MTSKIRIAILTSIILFIGFGEVAFAKGDTEKVLYDNSFEVNDNALLSVMHEMGNVTCKNWDRRFFIREYYAFQFSRVHWS